MEPAPPSTSKAPPSTSSKANRTSTGTRKAGGKGDKGKGNGGKGVKGAGKRVAVKRVAKAAEGHVRVVDDVNAAIADAVSGVFVSLYHTSIVVGVQNLSKRIAKYGTVYAHGSYALYAAAASEADAAVAELSRRAVSDPVLAEVIEPLTTMPRDIDLCVRMKTKDGAPDCKSLKECAGGSEVVREVLGCLRGVRRSIHNLLADPVVHDKVVAEMRDAVQQFGVEEFELVNSSHLNIDDDGDAVKMVRRGTGSRQTCDASNMPLLTSDSGAKKARDDDDCYPLFDSFNSTIMFVNRYSGSDGSEVRQPSDFLLARVAVGVKVRLRGEEKPRFISVYFLDVSILRTRDQAFFPGAEAPSVRTPRSLAPYPNLAYVFENTVKQLAWYVERPASSGTSNKVRRLRTRLVTIALLDALTQTRYGLPGHVTGLLDDVPQFMELCRAVLRGLAPRVSWWSPELQRVCAAFAVAQVDALVRESSDALITRQAAIMATQTTAPAYNALRRTVTVTARGGSSKTSK